MDAVILTQIASYRCATLFFFRKLTDSSCSKAEKVYAEAGCFYVIAQRILNVDSIYPLSQLAREFLVLWR